MVSEGRLRAPTPRVWISRRRRRRGCGRGCREARRAAMIDARGLCGAKAEVGRRRVRRRGRERGRGRGREIRRLCARSTRRSAPRPDSTMRQLRAPSICSTRSTFASADMYTYSPYWVFRGAVARPLPRPDAPRRARKLYHAAVAARRTTAMLPTTAPTIAAVCPELGLTSCSPPSLAATRGAKGALRVGADMNG